MSSLLTKVSNTLFLNFPCKSKIICCAALGPIPGIFFKYETLLVSIALIILLSSPVAKSHIAVLQPIPLTKINFKNISFSSLVLNPYKKMPSSLTC